MKRFKKLFSMVLVAAMVLSMNLTSFAATSQPSENERPVRSVTASVDGLTSITVGSTAASIVQDVNQGGETESQIYARAQLPAGTELSLKNQTVKITSSKEVKWQNETLTPDNGVYTITGVDFFNKYYDVEVGGVDIRLAAGLPAGAFEIPDTDSLKISDLKLGNVETEFTAVNTANQYYANDFYEYPKEQWDWTSIVYQFTAESSVSSSTVSGTMKVASGATVTGCTTGTGTGSSAAYTFDLTAEKPTITVTDANGNSRLYYVSASVASDNMSVTYAINLHEVVNSTYYTGTTATKCDEIIAGAKGYLEDIGASNIVETNESISGVISVAKGTDAMQPMLDLTEWATDYGEFSYETKNSGTYLSKLNGLGEFDCGQMSGWMYTADPAGYSATCKGPNVGAASYTMSDGETITWYMTTNYFNHF